MPTTPFAQPILSFSEAPQWVDPVSRVPNFFGDWFGRGLKSCTGAAPQILRFTGAGEGEVTGNSIELFSFFTSDIDGPGGPYSLSTNITGTGPGPIGPFAANENPELTGFIQASIPGASFLNGTITFNSLGEILDNYDFFFDYILGSSNRFCVALPNPSGGGLVGRNKYFDNGSALPQDRVYFFYNHVGNFSQLGRPIDINRYVVGAETTFLGGLFSVEVRVPFAGTASSDQTAGQPLSASHTEFGNIGLVLKGVVYRTPNCLLSVGMGISMPTADDSRLLIGNTPTVAIENKTWLLQPLVGLAWAPTDRFYAQLGLQFDFDPSGNPVTMLSPTTGRLERIGRLNDYNYAFLSGGLGYWVYQNDANRLSGLALQGELHYNRSLGTQDSVQSGNISVTDLGGHVDILNGSAGAIFRFGQRTDLSIGVSFPLSSNRLYDWGLHAQFNY